MAGMYGCFRGRNSDSAAMASGPPDVMANQEPAEAQEECSGKKKSKFQTFKKFFARKKRKEPAEAGADTGLKASQSNDDVSKPSESNALARSEKEKGSGSKISLGNKALSHDSVFVSDSSEANEALGASQDSIHGKVKSLQLQLKQAIRLGSPPSLMCVKRTEDAGTMSEDDGLPCSPPEYTTPHTAMNQAQGDRSISLEGIDSDGDQLSCAASSRAMSPLVVPVDFSQPASPFGCLDNSAAKHKRGLRLKACNKRKPASRSEARREGDSVVDEMLNTSVTDAAEEEEQKSEAVSFDELKPKVERKEEEEEEGEEDMEEEKEQSHHSSPSLLGFKEEERDEGEDESEAEQEISHSPDISSSPELRLSEDDAPGAQAPPSSEPSSRASSLESPRATPEPPAGPREYLLDPPGISYGAEKSRADSEAVQRMDEDEVLENREAEEKVEEEEEEEEQEESSFLQEVLSSLKTPLTSCALTLETENVVLETKEEQTEKEDELAEMEDGEKVEEEEAEEDEPVGYQAAPSLMLDHTTEKEEEVCVLSSEEEEVAPVEEEEESDEEEAAEEDEEEPVVELFVQHSQEEEATAERQDVEDVEPEEINDALSGKSDIHAQGERQEEEGAREEELMELEKEPQVDEEEEEVMEVSARVEKEAEEAIAEESRDAEEMMDHLPDAAAEEAGVTLSLQESDEGEEAVVGEEATEHPGDDEIPTELGDQVVDKVQEEEENVELDEEDEKIELSEEKSEREDDVETRRPDVGEPEDEDASERSSSMDTKQEDQAEAAAAVPAQPPPLSLQELPHEIPSQESGAASPSRTSMIHINLVSPSSEKGPSFFQQSPAAEDVNENITAPPSPPAAATESGQEDTVEEAEEDKQSTLKEEEEVEEATPPASLEETKRPSSGCDQSKVRFTITPAWQRSQSLTPPSSPPADSPSAPAVAGHAGEEAGTAAKAEPGVKAESPSSPKVEPVLSPGRARNAGSSAGKLQSSTTPSPPCIKPQSSAAAASTEEGSVVVEGNPDNPFGVRLRKTSTLHLFSSEEENTESPIESPAQPSSCKAEPPLPAGAKPSITQPASNKPALPKKPDVHGDSGVNRKSLSDPAAARGVSGGSDSPSWISVAKQKQRIYKENSLEEIAVKKDEPERKSSLPMCVSSASREQSSKEMSKPSASMEKETRQSLSPPTPVPPQPSKTQSLPSPVPPKPLVPPAASKTPAQPAPDHRSLPAATPVPFKSPSCTSPPTLSKPASSAPQPQSTTVPSAPFSSRTTPEKSPSRAAGLSGQTPSSQRGLPPTALPQDEPPWMALAKKKAKAWSEMPQIVQ